MSRAGRGAAAGLPCQQRGVGLADRRRLPAALTCLKLAPPGRAALGALAAVQLRSAYPRFAGLPACYAECLLLTHLLPAIIPRMQ